jgi:transcriptional regulator with XRE-family HTH domain
VRDLKPLKEKISITIDGDILEKLKIESEKDDRSLSQYINIVLKHHINKIENNYAMPSMQGFFYICEFLGVTPSEFFNEKEEHPIAFKELADSCKKLNEKQLRLLCEFVKTL